MKHLLRIDELKKSTYLSAAEKLGKRGGIHKERARNIIDYVNSPDVQTLDKFKFKLYQEIMGSLSGNQSRTSKEIEISAKMRQVYCMDIELLDAGEFELEEIQQLTISFQFDFDNYEKNIVPFCFAIPVKLENDILKTKGKSEITEDYFGGVVLFSNRKDAVRFKKEILNEDSLMRNCPEFEKIRELFMMYSEGSEEYVKFVKAITSISVNDLYS